MIACSTEPRQTNSMRNQLGVGLTIMAGRRKKVVRMRCVRCRAQGPCRVCGMTPMTAGVRDGHRVGGFDAGGQAHISRRGRSTVAGGMDSPEVVGAQFPSGRGARGGGRRRGGRGAWLFRRPALAGHAREQARDGRCITRFGVRQARGGMCVKRFGA
ncbi:protein of unknown function [Burkholderia multivorans]